MHRKVFDSGKQRSLGSDVPLNDVRKAQKEKDKVYFFYNLIKNLIHTI